jgi:hypothetical protein
MGHRHRCRLHSSWAGKFKVAHYRRYRGKSLQSDLRVERQVTTTTEIDKTDRQSPDECSGIPVCNRRSHVGKAAENNDPRNYDRKRNPGCPGIYDSNFCLMAMK